MNYTILAQKHCKPCHVAKENLENNGGTVTMVFLEDSPWARTLMKKAGLKTTPQVFNDKGELV